MSRPSSRPIAVLDIDGVLADVRHRLRHLECRPKDWASYFRAAPLDPPLAQGLVTAARLAEVCEVVYVSGRPEPCRTDTLAWLRRHGLPPGALHLRPARDYRPAADLKLEVVRDLAERAVVSVVVDDDLAVIETVRRAGFDVLPADWMADAQVLQRVQEQEGRT